MKIFLFDPLDGAESRRPWGRWLGEFDDVTWSAERSSFECSGGTMDSGVLIAHYSRLEGNGLTKEMLAKYCEERPGIIVLIVSGAPPVWDIRLSNAFVRKACLGTEQDDPFKRQFRRFLDDLAQTGTPTFTLLEPEVPVLEAIAILCQTFVVAGVAAGVIRSDGELAASVGFGESTAAWMLSAWSSLEDLWPRMLETRWWTRSLGMSCDLGGEASDDMSSRVILGQLIRDLGLESAARESLGCASGLDLAGLPCPKLVAFAKKQTTEPAKAVMSLLTAPVIEASFVKSAYESISKFQK